MSDLQYVIKCIGGRGKISFDLVYKKDILFDPDIPVLKKGVMIEFRYQKSAKAKAEIWKGEIMEVSNDEEYLHEVKDALVNEYLESLCGKKEAGQRKGPGRPAKRKGSRDENNEDKENLKKRKKPLKEQVNNDKVDSELLDAIRQQKSPPKSSTIKKFEDASEYKISHDGFEDEKGAIVKRLSDMRNDMLASAIQSETLGQSYRHLAKQTEFLEEFFGSSSAYSGVKTEVPATGVHVSTSTLSKPAIKMKVSKPPMKFAISKMSCSEPPTKISISKMLGIKPPSATTTLKFPNEKSPAKTTVQVNKKLSENPKESSSPTLSPPSPGKCSTPRPKRERHSAIVIPSSDSESENDPGDVVTEKMLHQMSSDSIIFDGQF